MSKAEIKAAADRALGVAPDDPEANRGRPSDYQTIYCEQAKKLCELGATDIEIAAFFNVSDRTIYRWQIKYPEFCQALKAGKEAADERVERSLYHRATGYSYESEKIFQYQGDIIRAKIIEHVPPDTTAMIFWLKNRRPEDWRDKTEHVVRHEVHQMSDDELLRIAARGGQGITPTPANQAKLN